MQVVRKKASLPDISLGKSTEPLKTRQYVPRNAYDITDVLDFSNFLPERTRDIFYMSRIEGMTHSKIAEILGISTRAVEKHLQNSVQEYRRHFGISDSHHKPS